MANNYGRRDQENYGRRNYERGSGYNREGQYGEPSSRYRTEGSRRMSRQDYGRDYERDDKSGAQGSSGYERDYGLGRYNRKTSYGNRAETDYDLGREESAGDYFTGADYGSGYSSGTGFRRDFDRDDYSGMSDYGRTKHDKDNYSTGTYGSRYDSARTYASPGYERNYRRSGYGRDYERGNYGDRLTGDYRDTSGSYGRDYDRERYDYDYEERGWWDRATDEVASWLGDEDAARRRRMDARYHGENTGRGPKNYKRSDSRIEEDINDKLTYDSYIDASDITVSVENSEVTLTGTVPNRFTKRQAEDIAESVSGVTNVENRLRVKKSDYSYSTGATNWGAESMSNVNEGTNIANTSEIPTGTSALKTTGTSSSTGSSKSKTAS